MRRSLSQINKLFFCLLLVVLPLLSHAQDKQQIKKVPDHTAKAKTGVAGQKVTAKKSVKHKKRKHKKHVKRKERQIIHHSDNDKKLNDIKNEKSKHKK